jgi:Fasciclin domain
LISTSKFTRNLTKYIDDDKDLVNMLNSTKANYTIFAPTDWAFAKLPEHARKPSKEVIKNILLYHISPDFWPVGRLLFSHTAPTLLELNTLGGKPQRLLAKFGFGGIKLNYYSKMLASNIVSSAASSFRSSRGARGFLVTLNTPTIFTIFFC